MQSSVDDPSAEPVDMIVDVERRRAGTTLVLAIVLALVIGALGGFAVGRSVSAGQEPQESAQLAAEGPSTTPTSEVTAEAPPPVTAPEPLGEQPPSVVVVGNSITYLTEQRLRDRLGTDFTASVRGVPGMHIEQAYPLIDDFLSSEPPYAFVVQLGTNDAGAHDADAVAAYEALVSRLEPVACRILVTVTTHTPDPEFVDVAVELNEWIRLGEIAGLWRMVDWDEIVGKYFDDGEPFGPLTTDLVHPTPLGQDVLAAAIADEVRSCR